MGSTPYINAGAAVTVLREGAELAACCRHARKARNRACGGGPAADLASRQHRQRIFDRGGPHLEAYRLIDKRLLARTASQNACKVAERHNGFNLLAHAVRGAPPWPSGCNLA
jgi:hypothetical protein